MSTRNVAAHLADHLAILDLLNRYTNALNQRDWAAMESAFTRDASWEAGGPELGDMAQAFKTAKGIAQGIANLVTPMDLLVQSNHAPVIEVHGDSATAVSTLQECGLPPDAAGMMVMWGTYHDDIVREADGEWRFRARKFRFTWIDQTGPKGQVMTRFPRAS